MYREPADAERRDNNIHKGLSRERAANPN